MRALIEALNRERTSSTPQQEVVRQLINTIITVAARNISLVQSPSAQPLAGGSEAIPLLNYIHQHIYEPERLKADQIAAAFHVSPTYVSEYFKTRTGQSLQNYIVAYKIKLIETRLRYTSMQINEIVYEFGFSDASHLNRLFKKHNGVNPSEYRKSFNLGSSAR